VSRGTDRRGLGVQSNVLFLACWFLGNNHKKAEGSLLGPQRDLTKNEKTTVNRLNKKGFVWHEVWLMYPFHPRRIHIDAF